MPFAEGGKFAGLAVLPSGTSLGSLERSLFAGARRTLIGPVQRPLSPPIVESFASRGGGTGQLFYQFAET